MTLAGAAGSYDRRCTHVTSEESQDRAFRGETHVVRLKMPDTPPEFTDLTYGTFGDEYSQRARRKKLVASETGYDDPVIVKSDGLPTYHFANVVDDHHMKITHVIRAAVCLLIMMDRYGSDTIRNGSLQRRSISPCTRLLVGNPPFSLTSACSLTPTSRNSVSAPEVNTSSPCESRESYPRRLSIILLFLAGLTDSTMISS